MRDKSEKDKDGLAMLRSGPISMAAPWWAGAWSAFVGGFVLLGWAFDIAAFKSLHPSWVAMKANTALCFVLVGLSLMMTSGPSSTRAARVARLCALLAGLIGALTLGEYVWGVSIGIDQLLFYEPAGAVGTSVPGRMAPETALCFALLATAIWITSGLRQIRWAGYAVVILGLLVTTLALAALLCYFTPALGAFGWWGLTIMAVHATLTFAVLGLAVISIAWQQGVLSWSLHRKTTVAFACGLVLLVVIGLNTSRSQVRLRETAQEVAYSEEILSGNASVLAAVADAQTHARGYLFTGDERVLRFHLAALSRCEGEMDELRALIADRPRQQLRFARLEAQVKEALQWSQQAIDARQTSMAALGRLQLVEHGEDLMDQLRATFEQVEGEERQSLEQAVQEEDKVGRLSYQIISAGTFASLVIFLALLFGLNRAAGERRRAAETLSGSEVRYRRLFEAARDGILLLDAETGRVVDVNPFLIEVLGFSREVFLGKKIWELGSFKDIVANQANFAELQEKGYIRYEDKPLETADGRRIEVEFVSNVYLMDHHQVIQCNIRDITARKELEKALREKNEQLGAMTQQLWQVAKLATMGELAAGIAHELNNPLTTVSLRVEAMLEQTPVDHPERAGLEIVAQEVDRMGQLVANLLNFSRHRQMQISSLDLRQEIEGTQELIQYHLRNHGITLEYQLAADLPLLQADRQQLRQLLLNLLSNAADAMPRGGLLVVRAHLVQSGLAIEVADTGVGIPPEHLSRVMEPFFTTKEEGKGTGLGLAICRRIAKEHGGSIHLESEPGRGTTVRVVFPLEHGLPNAAIEAEEPDR